MKSCACIDKIALKIYNFTKYFEKLEASRERKNKILFSQSLSRLVVLVRDDKFSLLDLGDPKFPWIITENNRTHPDFPPNQVEQRFPNKSTL